jgi:PAS domain S-box-containing protein
MHEFEFEIPEIIKGLNSTYGDEFFNEITLQLNKIIGTDYSFVASVDMAKKTAKTISMVVNGEIVDNFEYGLIHSPCAVLVNEGVCIYPENICSLFPKDQMLIDMNIEGYLGVALLDSHQETVGIIVALHKTKIQKTEFVRTVFELFSGRISAEMERIEQNHNLEMLNLELAQAQAHAKIGSWKHDLHTEKLQWSDEIYRLFGLDTQSKPLLFVDSLKLIHSEDQQLLQAYHDKAINEGSHYCIDVRLPQHDGTDIWVDVRSETVFDDSGTLIMIRGTAQDITLRKQAEIKIKSNENVLRTLIQSLPDLVWLKDVDGVYLSCNQKFERFFGYEEAKILGKKDYDFLDKELANVFRKNDKIAMLAGKPTINEEELTFADDGHKELTETIKSPVYGPDGTVIGTLGIGRDITERRLKDEQLRRSQKMDTIGQLTGGIAHDFNNILGIVSGNLELLQSMLPKGSKEYERVEKALKGTMRGSSITRKLLNFSRQDAVDVQPTNINDSIVNSIELIKKSLTPLIHIETHLDKSLWITEVGQGDFEDALLNISLNAHDAMPDGGTLTITTSNQVLPNFNSGHALLSNSSEEKSDFVVISINDTGAGMTEEVSDKALEPFFTTKDKSKGTGLGLSMVHGFVNRSGGRIEINSIIDEGSTFTLLLPRIKKAVNLNSPQSIDIEYPKGDEIILIVDDEEALRETTEHLLTELGYTVFTAASGDEALKILESGTKIDLLFSDVVMQGKLDGYKLATVAHKQQPSLKILLTSGYVHKRDTTLPENNVYLSNLLAKPYRQLDLALAIHRTLNADNK